MSEQPDEDLPGRIGYVVRCGNPGCEVKPVLDEPSGIPEADRMLCPFCQSPARERSVGRVEQDDVGLADGGSGVVFQQQGRPFSSRFNFGLYGGRRPRTSGWVPPAAGQVIEATAELVAEARMDASAEVIHTEAHAEAAEWTAEAYDATVETTENTDLVYVGKPISTAGWPADFRREVRLTHYAIPNVWRAEVIDPTDGRLCMSYEDASAERAWTVVLPWTYPPA